MKKINLKKLSLSKETIAVLSGAELSNVVGGTLQPRQPIVFQPRPIGPQMSNVCNTFAMGCQDTSANCTALCP